LWDVRAQPGGRVIDGLQIRSLPDESTRRRWRQAIAFAAATLAILATAWVSTDGRWPPAPLLALPLAGLIYAVPALGRLGRRLAARPLGSACVIGGLALVATALVTLAHGVRAPAVPDEFSYLLAADTFAHGRVTNPPHPMWIHFESLHIIQQPTYMSKYSPAQGLALAIGQATLGLPVAGAWLSAGLACGALTWMLGAWMPGRWALAGGLLAVVHHLTILWSQNYWGGLIAVLGGALLVGALGRLVRRPAPRARHAVVLGVGLGLLANSRPYEGLVVGALLLIALGIWMVSRHGPPVRIAATRILLPLAGVGLLLVAGMAYYNYRGTGHPLTTPYAVWNRQYMPSPLFIYQAAPPRPVFRHERLARAYGTRPSYPTAAELAASIEERAMTQAAQFFGAIPIVIAIAALWPLERNPWYHLAVLALALFTVGLGFPMWMWSHYVAPGVGLGLLIVMRALRRIGLWRPAGVRLGRAIAVAGWLFMMTSLAWGSSDQMRPASQEGWPGARARISASLARTGAKHLVMVRYAPRHAVGWEWIYNAADIDAAPVVWAADMDPVSNARLFDYFRDRQVWLLEPDRPEIELVPYPTVPHPSAPSP
jgi:hypothetical protein